MMAPGLRCVCTSMSCLNPSSCGCWFSVRLWIDVALAENATRRAANGAKRSFFIGTPVKDVQSLPTKVATRRRTRQPIGQASKRKQSRLFLLDDQIPGERVGFDDAFALAEGRFHPPRSHSVLPGRGALHREVDLVAQLAAVRGVTELERALRIDRDAQLAGDGLGAQVAVPGADSAPLQRARSRLEFDLRRRGRADHQRAAGDGVQPDWAGGVLDAYVARDRLHVRLADARDLHVAGERADANLAEALCGEVAGHRAEVEAAAPGQFDSHPAVAQLPAAVEGGLDAVAEGIERDAVAVRAADGDRDLLPVG